MSQWFAAKLKTLAEILDHIEDPEAVRDAMTLLEVMPLESTSIARMMLYAETLPKAEEFPLTPAKRHLHFLWDVFDKLPLSVIVPFSIPFRRMLAERLFARCGAAFIAEENLRFNFAPLIEIGDGVFVNRNVFIDSKGGVTLGSGSALAEDVRIITHTHGEASHIERTYKPVVVGDFAKIYTGAVLLPGVTVGRQAIVAAGSLVVHDVPDNAVVAGRPAKVLRERQTEGRAGDGLDHIWLF